MLCTCMPVCSLNLTIHLVLNFTNTNMSPYFSISRIKIWIWISSSLVVSGPSIKFDWVWPTLTELWPRLCLNPTVWELTFLYTLQIKRIYFKSKYGCDGNVLCTCTTMLSQSNHLIGLKFHQHQYVTILFNSNDLDLNMNFTKSSGLGTMY